MSRPRGRPTQGTGVTRDVILATALALLDEGGPNGTTNGTTGSKGLSMRALASRLGVTPMSLYRHVDDYAGLLRALSDEVYAGVLAGMETELGHRDTAREEARDEVREAVRELLIRYHAAVCRHPQLTLAIFATPEAFAGVTRRITDRLTDWLGILTTSPVLWRDILIDHAHGSGLPFAHDGDENTPSRHDDSAYRQALDCLLNAL